MKNTILIYDQDPDHVKRLGDFIREYSLPETETIEFSIFETLTEYLKEREKSNDNDMNTFLVCSEEIEENFEFENKILLTEDRCKEDKNGNRRLVYRYQAGKEISLEILSYVESGKTEKKVPKRREDSAYPVYFVIGIDTFDPLGIAKKLNDSYEDKYLLVDIRPINIRINTEEVHETDDPVAGLSRLLFALNSQSLDVEEMMLKTIIKNGECSIIKEVNSFTDIACLTGEGVDKIATAAKRIGYEGIIVISDYIGVLALGRDILKGKLIVVERSCHTKENLSESLLKAAGLSDAEIKLCQVINADNNEHIKQSPSVELEKMRACNVL